MCLNSGRPDGDLNWVVAGGSNRSIARDGTTFSVAGCPEANKGSWTPCFGITRAISTIMPMGLGQVLIESGSWPRPKGRRQERLRPISRRTALHTLDLVHPSLGVSTALAVVYGARSQKAWKTF